jgi:hypothetical protein
VTARVSRWLRSLRGCWAFDVFRRAERERRRRQRNWIAGLSAVAVALAGLAIWAEINRREAVAQRQEAERNFEIAKQGANSLVFDMPKHCAARKVCAVGRCARSSAPPRA